MYLHIGASVVIPEQDVLGIFDLDNTTSSRITRNFLAQAPAGGPGDPRGGGSSKSFLLCRDKGGKVKVYLSQLSTATLLKRMELGSLTI